MKMQGLPYASAAKRNRQPILEELRNLLPDHGTVLEIGSGTGEHAVFFCRHLPGITWQPSDREDNLAGLEARFARENNPRILAPVRLDVVADAWPATLFEAAYSANTAHIMPWRAVGAMFAGVSSHLCGGGRFCLYGPFNIDDRYTAASNAQFDIHLRATDPRQGIRDMAAIEMLANEQHMKLAMKIAMPANNFILVFKKEP